MRFASLKSDYWELESGEQRRAANGETFWLPEIEVRSGLRKGQLAKLLFLIEAFDENGKPEIGVERMWVLVTQVEAEFYVGRLVNQPACLEPAENVYLSLGAEIPFGAEHVIDVHEWSEKDVQDFMANAPLKSWHRAGA